MTTSRAKQAVERFALRGLTGLPEVVQRRIGRPVVRDTQTLADDVRLMLALQRVAREPAVETMPIPEGRVALARQTALIAGDDPVAEVRDLQVAGMAARLYVPSQRRGAGSHPTLLFFHGGGFVYGDLESHDAPCRLLASEAGVRVLAVDYRLAPEHRFPAAHDDALAAYRWLLDHAAEVGADTSRLAVGGDSAGGNLAAATALTAAQEGLPLALQLLIYPGTDALRDTESLRLFGDGFYLTQGFIDLAAECYYPQLSDDERRDPRLSPAYADLGAEVAGRLAPVFLCTAGFDPLRDEGEAYARRLEEAGVAVELRRFEDQIHGFLNMTGAGRSPRAAVVEIAHRLEAGLA
ncbi:acetyl esterase [Nocardioides marinisabuli]|uniref:Acetyl esterase n=1 Tax=Nocardioides marinisabuli TaxID=419476 RepID=A0A7Y9F0T5_9ACTN|nr:alpha/beta hydrolase [Nocardioides marinisabuli]NYD57524.1 acetyl esterase [Nocardioides marinisabuli]